MARQGAFDCCGASTGCSARLMVAKWFLIVFNVAFWTMGVISLALGLWIYLTMNEYATFSEGKD
ncbi:hypothetical protein GBAR_LOCUS16263, partial [Geodia barretti]